MSFRRAIFPMACSSKSKGASACSDSKPGQLVSEIPEYVKAQVIPWSSPEQGAHKQSRMQHHCSGGYSLDQGAGSKASKLFSKSFPLLVSGSQSSSNLHTSVQCLPEILCKLKYHHLFNTAFRGEIIVI